jgi:hypothetical protein
VSMAVSMAVAQDCTRQAEAALIDPKRCVKGGTHIPYHIKYQASHSSVKSSAGAGATRHQPTTVVPSQARSSSQGFSGLTLSWC